MLIGLTGSIAAGKSTVSGRLVHLGAHVLDADVVAREVVEPGTRGLAMLEQAFGSDILTESGMLDRRALAARVFGNAEMLRTLNTITHPLVVECMAERSGSSEGHCHLGYGAAYRMRCMETDEFDLVGYGGGRNAHEAHYGAGWLLAGARARPDERTDAAG